MMRWMAGEWRGDGCLTKVGVRASCLEGVLCKRKDGTMEAGGVGGEVVESAKHVRQESWQTGRSNRPT